jgi:molybdate-binding protein/DNA-binding transcriptional regulator YhcF (GntR family)
MENQPTYQVIFESIREEIYTGKLKPGDKLPGVREMSQHWQCTPGTVQHAYALLVRSGLVSSRQGRGTVVSELPSGAMAMGSGLRRANLVIKAEQFLLESFTSGYSMEEITEALTLATEHWRVMEEREITDEEDIIRITGSSDPVINALADAISTLLPGIRLQVQIGGSMAGLMALNQGTADMAGCHLWDVETNSYNLPFIKKILPNRKMKLITFAHRRLGLITARGNPKGIHIVADLRKSGIRFVNRQNGSGTRVWLDEQLRLTGIKPDEISGYESVKSTHLEIAREIAEGRADAGLGLESAAAVYGLHFQMLALERYDLVMDSTRAEQAPLKNFIDWLGNTEAKEFISRYEGYDTSATGKIVQS